MKRRSAPGRRWLPGPSSTSGVLAPCGWGPEHQARIGRRDKSAVIAARGSTVLGHSRRTGEISLESGNAELAPLGHLAPIAMGTPIPVVMPPGLCPGSEHCRVGRFKAGPIRVFG